MYPEGSLKFWFNILLVDSNPTHSRMPEAEPDFMSVIQHRQQWKLSAQSPLLYSNSKTVVYRGIPVFLIFFQKRF